MGNPTSHRGHNLEWGRIRLLTKWDDIEIAYNANGIRTRKGDTYYELDGDSIISETTNGSTIRYYYGNGGIVGFRYNGSRYYYEKNLMGDIIAIYGESGNKVGAYTYDAWGNTVITVDISGIATVNPFRYRGYYYDADLGLYYLKSRYYDSQVGRFINADGIEYLGANGSLSSYNLYVYCDNSPTAFKDSNGTAIETIFDIISLGVSIVEVVLNPTDVWAWVGLAGDVIDLIPVVTCVGEAVRGGKAVYKAADNLIEIADTTTDASKATKRASNISDVVHGNSLATTRTNYGYILVDSNGEIMKFGESLNPKRRYTNKWLDEHNYSVIIVTEGDKISIHKWHQNMNNAYKEELGYFPLENKNGR